MTRNTRGALVAAAVALATIAAALWFLRADDARGAVELDAAAVVRARTATELEPTITSPHAAADSSGARAEVQPAIESPAGRIGPTLVVARVTAAETGLPVPHVYITAWRENGTILATPQKIQTDEGGQAEIEVEPQVPLIVSAQGNGLDTSSANVAIPPLAAGERRAVSLTVLTREDLVVHGIVLRRDTREPIVNVTVETMPVRHSGPGPRATTGNDGHFRLSVRSFATASLRYEHPDFGMALSPARAGHEEASRALEILLEPCASIRTTIVAADGADTDGWSAVATTQPWAIEQPNGSWVSGPAELRWTANVDAGVALVARVPARAPIELEIRRGSRAIWHSREPIVLVPGEVRELECRTGEASIHGVVREADGTPAASVEMRVGPAREMTSKYIGTNDRHGTALTTTDEDGAYRFESLQPGAWLVGPAPSARDGIDARRDPAPIAQRVVLEPGGIGVRHDVTLVRGLVITGNVVMPDAKLAPLARVTATNNGGVTWTETITDQDGNFTVGPLIPGTWRLQAQGRDASPSDANDFAAGTEGIVLRLGAEARFTVRVRDDAGLALADALVSVGSSEGRGNVYSVQTDAQGLAHFGNLVAATYNVVATTNDGRYAAQREVVIVEGSTVEVQLVARAEGRARLRFEGPGESALVIVIADRMLVRYISLTRGAAVDVAGPVGDVELQLQVDGKRHDKKVVLGREPGHDIVFDGVWK